MDGWKGLTEVMVLVSVDVKSPNFYARLVCRDVPHFATFLPAGSYYRRSDSVPDKQIKYLYLFHGCPGMYNYVHVPQSLSPTIVNTESSYIT